MSTMNISLPESLKTFVDEQVTERGYATNSEYIRALLRRELDREKLRDIVLQGEASPPAGPPDFEALRDRVRSRTRT